MQLTTSASRLISVGERVLQSLLARVICAAVTVLAALAFVPLGLVSPPTRWIVATGLAWVTATAGVIGLARRRRLAYLTPSVLVIAWFVVQW